jgi:hypothetical protein
VRSGLEVIGRCASRVGFAVGGTPVGVILVMYALV